MSTAKLFWSGRSQAVRLPRKFRLEGDRVRIRKHGEALILEPISADWAWLDAISGKMSSGFMTEGRDQPATQEREGLAEIFP